MTITYTATGLDDIAKQFDTCAMRARTRAAQIRSGTIKGALKQQAIRSDGEAIAWENAADILRKTTLIIPLEKEPR